MSASLSFFSPTHSLSFIHSARHIDDELRGPECNTTTSRILLYVGTIVLLCSRSSYVIQKFCNLSECVAVRSEMKWISFGANLFDVSKEFRLRIYFDFRTLTGFFCYNFSTSFSANSMPAFPHARLRLADYLRTYVWFFEITKTVDPRDRTELISPYLYPLKRVQRF